MSQKIETVSEFVVPDRIKKEQEEKDFNPSGIQPVEYRCLVKPFAIEETDEAYKSAIAAGIIVDRQSSDREQMAQCVALLVACGGNAFEDWKDPKPKPGDRINIAKYAGVSVIGCDGRGYRLCQDKDIAGILFQPTGEDPYKVEEESAD